MNGVRVQSSDVSTCDGAGVPCRLTTSMAPGNPRRSISPYGSAVTPSGSRWICIVGISTYGSPRLFVKLLNDGGRRMLTRALRLNCGWRTRIKWLALYALDTLSEAERRAFLERVEHSMSRRGRP